MKTKSTILILLALISISCGSGQLKTTTVEENEAIIVARAFVINDGEQAEKKWNFLWDERLWGKNAVWVEKDGFVSMKLPAGKHHIALLQYRQYTKNIPDEYLSIDVEGGKIYYIGDLSFQWDFSEKDVNTLGLAGALANSQKKDIGIKVDVKDNYEETVAFFNQKYGNSREVQKQLIKVTSPTVK